MSHKKRKAQRGQQGAAEDEDDNKAAVEELPKEALLRQGAEARLYRIEFQGKATAVKERFVKKYRHPDLDARLTKKRTTTEVRCMEKCRKMAIDVPAIYHVDHISNRIYMEFVEGQTVRDYIRGLDLSDAKNDEQVNQLAEKIGTCISALHKGNIVHGDLTTSNMILRRDSLSLVVIDFGLSYISTIIEDKAVDLYVLERALLSTHAHSEKLFQLILEMYGKSENGPKVIERLAEVRARGRKRVMLG